jgi:hypothetical protein
VELGAKSRAGAWPRPGPLLDPVAGEGLVVDEAEGA